MDKHKEIKKAVEVLKGGGLCILPSETIYGIMADATNSKAISKLYKLRRPSGRPFILLLPDHLWLGKLNLIYNEKIVKLLYRTEGLTVILPKKNPIPLYLTKGKRDLAVRIPQKGIIKNILLSFKKPIAAPSANPEGKIPATTVEEAKKYFGDKVNFYLDGGILRGKPSTIIKIENDKVKLIREGFVKKNFLKKLLLLLGFEPLF